MKHAKTEEEALEEKKYIDLGKSVIVGNVVCKLYLTTWKTCQRSSFVLLRC